MYLNFKYLTQSKLELEEEVAGDVEQWQCIAIQVALVATTVDAKRWLGLEMVMRTMAVWMFDGGVWRWRVGKASEFWQLQNA